MGIEREQHFDALALVQRVSELSPGGHTSTGLASPPRVRNWKPKPPFSSAQMQKTSRCLCCRAETEATFWQINWCRVRLPAKTVQVCTNDNSRLGMQVLVEDDTGHLLFLSP